MTGYTWALSHAAVPAILFAPDEPLQAKQWRYQYLMGFYVSSPTIQRARICTPPVHS